MRGRTGLRLQLHGAAQRPNSVLAAPDIGERGPYVVSAAALSGSARTAFSATATARSERSTFLRRLLRRINVGGSVSERHTW